MVEYYHVIFTAYGFWLPNDPRGSWSTFVGAWELHKFGGDATKTEQRRSLAHDRHDVSVRREMKSHLNRPPVKFTNEQRAAIVRGIERVCHENDLVVYAGCVGHDHAHLVIGRHQHPAERVVGLVKARATQQLRSEGLWSAVDSVGTPLTPWAEGCWKVFINDRAQLLTAIDYVNRHPIKEELPAELWPFLTPV